MKEPENPPRISCKHCGKPMSVERPGAISSYLLKDLRCNCGSASSSADSTKATEVCQRCLKKIPERSRGGSFTQFVFGAGRCQCQTPLRKRAIKLDQRKLDTLTKRWTREEGARRQALPAFPPGTLIGGLYKVEAVLGQGGMGVVYRARHQTLGRTCAVKMLDRDLIDQENWRRFQIEAKSISNLNHPCFVQVYDLALHENKQPYYVMDCLTGQTLEEILKTRGSLEPAQTLSIILEAADGLAFAHSHGVVHRDLKPANIFVERLENDQKRIKILDFGIAKLISSDRNQQSLTGLGDVFGTPYYMSPEQCLGDAVDARSDIYSLGCTIFEAISGKPPFDASQPLAIVEAHISASPPKLSAATNKNLPTGLEAVVAKCLEKDPPARYQNVQQLIAHLRLVAGGQGNSIQNSSTSGDAGEAPAKRGFDLTAPLLVSFGILAISGLALLAFGLTFLIGGKGNPNEKVPLVQRKNEIEVAHILAPINRDTEDLAAGLIQSNTTNEMDKITGTITSTDPPKSPTTLSVNGKIKYYQLDFGNADHGTLTIWKQNGPSSKALAKGKIVIPADSSTCVDFSPRVGNDIEAFKALPENFLKSLTIDVQLAENAINCLDKQKKIELLQIKSNFVSKRALDKMTQFKKLKSLSISGLADMDEQSLVNSLQKLPQLEIFKCEMVFYPNSSAVITALARAQKLRELKLSALGFSKSDLKTIASLKNIETLALEANEPYMNDGDLAMFAGRKKLVSLHLYNHMLTPNSSETFKSFSNLRRLSLSRTNQIWSEKDYQDLQKSLKHVYLIYRHPLDSKSSKEQ